MERTRGDIRRNNSHLEIQKFPQQNHDFCRSTSKMAAVICFLTPPPSPRCRTNGRAGVVSGDLGDRVVRPPPLKGCAHHYGLPLGREDMRGNHTAHKGQNLRAHHLSTKGTHVPMQNTAPKPSKCMHTRGWRVPHPPDFRWRSAADWLHSHCVIYDLSSAIRAEAGWHWIPPGPPVWPRQALLSVVHTLSAGRFVCAARCLRVVRAEHNTTSKCAAHKWHCATDTICSSPCNQRYLFLRTLVHNNLNKALQQETLNCLTTGHGRGPGADSR